MGPGLLESVYARCLRRELQARGLTVESQVAVPLTYRDVHIPEAYRLDLLVDGRVIVEVKAVEEIAPVHKAQLLTYLRLLDCRLGLLLNFHTALLKDGIFRLVNNLSADPLREPSRLRASVLEQPSREATKSPEDHPSSAGGVQASSASRTRAMSPAARGPTELVSS